MSEFNFIEASADPSGVNGNGTFISFVPDPIIHKFSLSAMRWRIPKFDGIELESAGQLRPSNDKYVQWLEDIAKLRNIPRDLRRVHAREVVEVSPDGVSVTFIAADGERLLRASYTPDSESDPAVRLRRHNGGEYEFATVMRWALSIRRFINLVEAYRPEPSQ